MLQAGVPAGTVTFLFSDIEGSTKLWEKHPDAMATALARHDAIMRGAIQSSGGFVFKTIGDQFCAAFAAAPYALESALAAQLALAQESWPGETRIKVRIALHTGSVESRDDDYFGPPVNRVARLLGIGHGGQILISNATYELVRDSLPARSMISDLGTHLLKDLGRPENVFQLNHPDLDSSFPELRSLTNRPNNLPLQITSFVGREAEIESVKSLFTKSRLVSLTGTGGAGKTRLAIQVGADLIDSTPDGVWLIELAAVTDVEAIARTLSETLLLPENRDKAQLGAIVDHIHQKSMLLILDNCEHLIEGCARLADTLLRSCPNLKILATSREALRIDGESSLRVPPLSFPASGTSQSVHTLSQYSAVRLFIDRALQADPSFAVTNENAPALASVCFQLDGIPLAIELAAARVRTLPIEQIGARLEKRFQLLTSGSRAALPRQQTLRALIDWSYDLLQPTEKSVLQRLSVFSSGWTLVAAEEVCADEETDTWQVSDLIFSLVEKSLVFSQELPNGHRYGLLESIREYAKERLEESGQHETYRDRHLLFYLALAKEAMPGLRGPDQKAWFGRLDPDHDNLRAALRHGVTTPNGLALTGYLWWYWYFRARLTEGRAWLTTALDANPDADIELRARALNGAGVLAEYQGDYQDALELLTESAELSRSIGDRWAWAMSINNVGNVYGTRGDYDRAETYWRQAYDIWREMEKEGTLTDFGGLGASLDNLGNVEYMKGHLDLARDLYQQGYEVRKRAGNLALAAYSLINLGGLEFTTGNLGAALTHYHNGLQISLDVGDKFAVIYFLLGLAELADEETAAMLLGQHDYLCEELSVRISGLEDDSYDKLVARLKAELTEDVFNNALNKGRSLTYEEATRLAQQVEI